MYGQKSNSICTHPVLTTHYKLVVSHPILNMGQISSRCSLFENFTFIVHKGESVEFWRAPDKLESNSRFELTVGDIVWGIEIAAIRAS